MELSQLELVELYEAVIKPSGHPHPLSYITRVLLLSGGDPDYIDITGKIGFMPVLPGYANTLVGSNDVATLQGNIMTTLAMEIKLYQETGDLEQMYVMFHDGIGTVVPSESTKEMLTVLPEAIVETQELVQPRLATVDDVMSMFESTDDNQLTDDQLKFFKVLVNG